jgi:hypothetical protein
MMPFIADDFKGNKSEAPAQAEPTYIRILVDESGSMEPYRDAAIESVNGYLASLGRLGDVKVTLAAFDLRAKAEMVRFHFRDVPVDKVILLSRQTYYPAGSTPLFDALAQMILAGQPHQKTIVVVQTDGYENASKEFDGAGIRALVKAREDAGWTFVFLGAGMGRFTAENISATIGVKASNVMNYGRGQEARSYATLGEATRRFAGSKPGERKVFFDEKERDQTKT